MAIFPVRVFGDPVLRARAHEVESVDESVRKLINDMLDTMRSAPGVGLAAPQIGISRRVIVWQNEQEQGSLANPVILDKKGEEEGEEGCLSLPGLAYPVMRAQSIVVEGLDMQGKLLKFEAENYTARIIQHEVDHIDGILFIDRLPPALQREAKKKLKEQALSQRG